MLIIGEDVAVVFEDEIGDRSDNTLAIRAGDEEDGGVVHEQVLLDLDCWIVFDIFLTIAAVVGDGARHEIDFVAHNTGVPGGCQELGKCAVSSLIGTQRSDQSRLIK